MRSFLKTHGWSAWILDSYNSWIFGDQSPIRRVIANLRRAKTKDGIEVYISPDDVEIRPIRNQTPSLCRANRETYAYEIWVGVYVKGEKRREKIRLGRFPRMVDSGNLLDSGYFVIDGMDRAYVNRESTRYDAPKFSKSIKGEKETYSVDLHSLDARLSISYAPSLKKKEMHAHVGFSSNQTTVNVRTLLRVLGETRTPREIWTSSPASELLGECFEEETEEEDAMYLFGKLLIRHTSGVSVKRTKSYAEDAVHSLILPFLYGTDEKKRYLENVLYEFANFVLGNRKETDLDAMENKRIDTAGNFVCRLVCSGIRDAWNLAQRKLANAPYGNDIEKILESDAMSSYVERGMKSGNGDTEKNAAILPRKAHWQEGLSSMRRVSVGPGSASYVAGPRMFHGTWYGFYCVCETQEGDRTGLTRETAVFFKCSTHGDHTEWRSRLVSSASTMASGKNSVFVNQSLCITNVDSDSALEVCRELKRTFDPYASIVVSDQGDTYVDVSEGRAMRPIWIGTPNDDMDFEEGIRKGKLMWIDAAMANRLLIATIPGQGEYSEMDACALFGISAANIPFSDHNAGSRNLFAAHVRHQAVGYVYPFANQVDRTHDRFDTEESHTLWYPQRAMCDTQIAREMQSHTYPNGWNAVIFILADAWGQEDSIGISQRHVDLGAGAIQSEISVKETVDFPKEWFGSVNSYAKIDTDGLPIVGCTIFPNEAYLCKRNQDRETEVVRWKKNFPVKVRSVQRSKNHMASVRFTWRRTPEIGDKLATRHGQKGVISFILKDDENTYWTRSGMTPDLIMSPAAFPTRMTIGHILEMLCGKTNALSPPPEFERNGCKGSITDCTPYSSSFDYKQIQETLRARGFQPKGHEVVYSAETGTILPNCQVYVGPAFVQRLTHFSFTKSYARGRGVRNPQTGQPPKGRRNDGGLRLGEGETKAFQAHGAASSLRTAFLDCSDGIDVRVCANCKEISSVMDRELQSCVYCGHREYSNVIVPRTFVLMRDQLRVAHVNMTLS
jgi:DNA-directed RNA polymerase subunit B